MPETKDELNQIYDLDPICDISCGARHLVMLTSCKKKVYVCGDNQLSQLGIPNLNEVTVKRTATHLPLQLRDDELVKAIACGAAHTLRKLIRLKLLRAYCNLSFSFLSSPPLQWHDIRIWRQQRKPAGKRLEQVEQPWHASPHSGR